MKSIVKDYPTSLGVPVDRTTKRVVSKGFNFEVKIKPATSETWDIPPRTVTPIESVKELIGTRQNRMRIVGYLGRCDNKEGQKLLARCDCGKYEHRRASTWRKMKAFNDMCRPCRQVEYLKNRHLTDEERDKKTALMKAKSNK